MIVSAGPNHTKILEFKFNDEEKKARKIITFQAPANEPIENFVVAAAHAEAKYCLFNITKIIKKQMKTNIDSGEYTLVFDYWRYTFILKPPMYDNIYIRLADEKEYKFIYHFLRFSYFNETFYSEFFKQFDEFLGPRSYDRNTFFWSSLSFQL